MIITIVLPTYNEKTNLLVLLPQIQRSIEVIEREQADALVNILIVDDFSPDATGAYIRELQQNNPRLYLLEGKKQGLGNAYIRGFRYAMDKLNSDILIEMDSDLSHDPEDLIRLIREAEGYDVVIGSRYIPGGTIPKSWPRIRRMISYFGNLFARLIAGIPSVRDCTSGFRAIRTSILGSLDLGRLNATGYYFQISLLHWMLINGCRVKEIPISFSNRRHGRSKLGYRDILEFIVKCLSIRLQSSKTFFRFLLVGLSGVIINLGLLSLLLYLGVNKYLASPISIEISIISNFLLNNYWTFASKQQKHPTAIRGVKFNIVSLVSLGLSYTVFIVITMNDPGIPPQIAQLIGILPATLVNYFLNMYWTFRAKKK